MLKRMVIALPRSLSTWAANWLTYDGQTCVHDPLYFKHYSEWNETYDAVSCTGIHDWPEFVAAQTCPVLVLHRPIGQIKASLMKFDSRGAGEWLAWDADQKLLDIRGPNIMHCRAYDLLTPAPASQIWRFLEMPSQFDVVRHDQLRRMRVEPSYETPSDYDPEVHARLMAELRERKARANAPEGDNHG